MGEETQQAKHLTKSSNKLWEKKERNLHTGWQLGVVWILTRDRQQEKRYRALVHMKLGYYPQKSKTENAHAERRESSVYCQLSVCEGNNKRKKGRISLVFSLYILPTEVTANAAETSIARIRVVGLPLNMAAISISTICGRANTILASSDSARASITTRALLSSGRGSLLLSTRVIFSRDVEFRLEVRIRREVILTLRLALLPFLFLPCPTVHGKFPCQWRSTYFLWRQRNPISRSARVLAIVRGNDRWFSY